MSALRNRPELLYKILGFKTDEFYFDFYKKLIDSAVCRPQARLYSQVGGAVNRPVWVSMIIEWTLTEGGG